MTEIVTEDLHDRYLERWEDEQRKLYHSGALTEEEAAKLEGLLGWDWNFQLDEQPDLLQLASLELESAKLIAEGPVQVRLINDLMLKLAKAYQATGVTEVPADLFCMELGKLALLHRSE